MTDEEAICQRVMRFVSNMTTDDIGHEATEACALQAGLPGDCSSATESAVMNESSPMNRDAMEACGK